MSEVVRIGLIADTHGLLRPEVAAVFAGVSRILHAGDVGGRAVTQGLERIAPVDAVFGNVDDPHDPSLTAARVVVIDGVTIHVSHGHELGRPTAALALARYVGDVIVFGHTHRPIIVREGNRLVVNPGAAGPRRFDLQPSVALLKVEAGRVTADIISLA